MRFFLFKMNLLLRHGNNEFMIFFFHEKYNFHYPDDEMRIKTNIMRKNQWNLTNR